MKQSHQGSKSRRAGKREIQCEYGSSFWICFDLSGMSGFLIKGFYSDMVVI